MSGSGEICYSKVSTIAKSCFFYPRTNNSFSSILNRKTFQPFGGYGVIKGEMSFRKKEDDMSTNPSQGQNPDQTNSYGGYGGYSGGGQQAPSSQPSYDPNDPYADPSAQQGAASGYGQQQTGYDQQQRQQT